MFFTINDRIGYLFMCREYSSRDGQTENISFNILRNI